MLKIEKKQNRRTLELFQDLEPKLKNMTAYDLLDNDISLILGDKEFDKLIKELAKRNGITTTELDPKVKQRRDDAQQVFDILNRNLGRNYKPDFSEPYYNRKNGKRIMK